jgi:hypothetical protein
MYMYIDSALCRIAQDQLLQIELTLWILNRNSTVYGQSWAKSYICNELSLLFPTEKVFSLIEYMFILFHISSLANQKRTQL